MPMSADPLSAYRLDDEPYYLDTGAETRLFEAAFGMRIPVMLKGPTGCGKTRFVERMAWKLGRPLVTVCCNEDMSAGDLLGRWLIDERGTRWQDGPLTLAARHGAICYLDEIVEARQDTTVAIHPLADSRRILPLDRSNELIRAHPDFQLVISYNPGYQGVLKDLKMSTRQRFAAIEFDYPPAPLEARILVHEAGMDEAIAGQLVDLGQRTRHLKGHGLEEGASTRMLIHAGALIARGIEPMQACRMAIVEPIADDPDMNQALDAIVQAVFARLP